jgi:DNA (cytosine-5)-methyltransferase 1
MWLSPDCKHFSKAKGGKPVSKKIRGLAWTAVRWAKAVKRPRVIVLENVEEFETWGPVARDTASRARSRKGQTFARSSGDSSGSATSSSTELRACDYGAPTIRKRLFLIARCDGRPIVWPAPTHGKGRAFAWRTAAECIDWSHRVPVDLRARSRSRTNTLRRIARGIRRYVIDSPRPFIVNPSHLHGDPLDSPMRTIAAGGLHAAEVRAFLVATTETRRRAARPDSPVPPSRRVIDSGS